MTFIIRSFVRIKSWVCGGLISPAAHVCGGAEPQEGCVCYMRGNIYFFRLCKNHLMNALVIQCNSVIDSHYQRRQGHSVHCCGSVEAWQHHTTGRVAHPHQQVLRSSQAPGRSAPSTGHLRAPPDLVLCDVKDTPNVLVLSLKLMEKNHAINFSLCPT